MITPSDRENLDALVGSAGFAWMQSHVEREWGLSGQRYQEAVKRAAEKGDQEAMLFLRCILFAKTEIDRLMQAPLAALQAANAKNVAESMRTDTAMSRRGPGL